MARRRRKLTREQEQAQPVVGLTGIDADLYSQAMTRFITSGGDMRLAPYAWPDDITQRYYDLYDAWANRGYSEPSPYWPPRRGATLIVGVDPDGNPPQRVRDRLYRPHQARIGVWGVGGILEGELAERGTLAMRRHHDIGEPDPGPFPRR